MANSFFSWYCRSCFVTKLVETIFFFILLYLFRRLSLILTQLFIFHPFLGMRTEELRAKRKKQLKKDTASKLKSLVTEVNIYHRLFNLSFHQIPST